MIMDAKKKKTLTLITITGITLVLGVIAVVTALRLRSIGTQPVAPTAPQSQPRAQEVPTPLPACFAEFIVGENACNGWCDSDSDCATGFCLREPGAPGVCRNSACAGEESCECPTPQHLECDTDTFACVLVDGAGTNECSVDTNGEPSADCSHTACNTTTQTCEIVPGGGVADECALGLTPDDCTIPTHLECISDACVPVPGLAGDPDQCDATDPNACQPETHLDCVDYACVPVPGGGVDDLCTIGGTECEPNTYTVCEDEACVQKTGDEPSTCNPDDPDACSNPQRMACVGMACQIVNEAGADTCSDAADCYYYSCTADNACGRVAGTLADSCNDNADCAPAKHNVCENNACVPADGEGQNECATDMDCESPTHQACSNNSCTTVIGGGIDSCMEDADCAPASTPTPGPSSTPRPTSPLATSAPVSTPVPTTPPALPQAGTTAPTVAIITMGAVLLLAGLAAVIAL